MKMNMNNEWLEEAKNKSNAWIANLSPETTKDLGIVLSAIIPISEVVGSNPFKVSSLPLRQFDFAQKGIGEERAVQLLEALISEVDFKQEMAIENEKLTTTLDAIHLLKHIKELIAEKLNQKQIKVQPSEFSDKTAELNVDGMVIQLPPHKSEHWFCQAAFEYSPNEPVDWQELYEKMTGLYEHHYGKQKGSKEIWRKVYDTMEAINKRVEEKGLPKLFAWQEKTVKRLR